MTEPHLHHVSIFDAPRVYAVREHGSLTLHLGSICINIYGEYPYNVVPVILEVTEEEYVKHKTAEAFKEVLEEADETAPVE